jgi:phosphotransferase system  glucose/maltose/N-acetylglucosamine-specific IIC component
MFKALKIVKNLNFFALLGIVVFVAIAVLASLGSLTEITAYAQRAGTSQVGGPNLPTDIFGDPIVGNQDDLVKTIVDIAQTIIFIFAAACVLIIIWGGIQWGISGTEDGSKKRSTNNSKWGCWFNYRCPSVSIYSHSLWDYSVRTRFL